MFEIILIYVTLITVIIVAVLTSGVRKVNDMKKGWLKGGTSTKTVEPGLRFIVPFVQRMFHVNVREQVIECHSKRSLPKIMWL